MVEKKLSHTYADPKQVKIFWAQIINGGVADSLVLAQQLFFGR